MWTKNRNWQTVFNCNYFIYWRANISINDGTANAWEVPLWI